MAAARRRRGGGGRPRRRGPAVLAQALFLLVLAAAAWIATSGALGALARAAVRAVAAEAGELRLVASGRGVVMRRETVLVAPVSGAVRHVAADGGRVRAGAVLVEITDTAGAQARAERLAELDRQVAAYDAAHGPELAMLAERRGAEAARLRAAIDAMAAAGASGDAAGFTRAWRRARSAAAAWADAAGRYEELSGGRRELEAAREQALAAGTEVVALRAAGPGIFSYRWDGLEAVFAPEGGREPGVRDVLRAVPAPASAGSGVRAGERVGRLVDTEAVWFAVVVRAGEAADLAAYGRVRVAIPELRVAVDGRVVRVGLAEAGGLTVLTVASDDFQTALVEARAARMEVSAVRATGVLVPRRALARRGDRTGVYVEQAGYYRFAPVIVGGQDRRVAAVSGIPAGARVVTNPWWIFLSGRGR